MTDETPASDNNEPVFLPATAVSAWRKYTYAILVAATLIVGSATFVYKDKILGLAQGYLYDQSVPEMQADIRTLVAEYIRLTNELVRTPPDERKPLLDRRAYIVGRITTLAAKLDDKDVPTEAARFVKFRD